MAERFYRVSGSESVLGGVCVGLSQRLIIDPVIIRLAFVLFFFTPVPSVIIYIILWIALPEHTQDTVQFKSQADESPKVYNHLNSSSMSNKPRQGSVVGGIVLIVLGSIFAFKSFFEINLFQYIGKMWPLLLIGLGLWLIVKDRMDDNDDLDNFNTPTKTGSTSDSSY